MTGATTRFDADTAVRRVGERVFEARIDRGWWISRGPNGGYVAAILLRALAGAVDDAERAPRSLTVHYTAVPAAGPARVEVQVERSGRTVTSLSARLSQDERLLALALAAFGRRREALAIDDCRMPEVAPPDRCAELQGPMEMSRRYETRWASDETLFGGGARALAAAWIRLREPRPVDAALLAAYSDALPPALFTRVADDALAGGLPTVDLTVHFRTATPVAGARDDDFTLAVFRSQLVRDGFVEESGELWSPGGLLLAQSRQLALVV